MCTKRSVQIDMQHMLHKHDECVYCDASSFSEKRNAYSIVDS